MRWHPSPHSFDYFGNVSDAAYRGYGNLLEWYGSKYPGLAIQWNYYRSIYERWQTLL